MYIPFENLPSHARLWIYQADRRFTNEEVEEINQNLQEFVQRWDAHGASLQGSGQVYYNQFIVLSVDQEATPPSGCSIDKSVALVRAIEDKFKVSLFTRTNIPFKIEEEVITVPMKEIPALVSEGKINAETITFNNLVENKGNFIESWEAPAASTWLKRYFNKN